MTREEAKKKIVRNHADWVWTETINRIYDDFELEIKVLNETISVQHRLIQNGEQRGYDKAKQDFESRTCAGCKFYDNENPQVTKKGYCSKFLRHEHSIFMCNRWEQK